MQVTIEIPESVAATAAQHGLSPEAYVQELLDTVRPHDSPLKPLSQEQVKAFLHDITQFSAEIPDYSDTKFDREFIYNDHD